jgi:hypothetical protein
MSRATFQYDDRTVEALQYDGTAESASNIAQMFGFSVVQQCPPAAVFAIPPALTFSPGDYYELDTREIALPAGSWVWFDRNAEMIGCEWDSYVREHFTSQRAPTADSVAQDELFAVRNVTGQEVH